jgi:hypothetical protein
MRFASVRSRSVFAIFLIATRRPDVSSMADATQP